MEIFSFFFQTSLPWVLRCSSAFLSTDAVKSAARANSALQRQVSATTTTLACRSGQHQIKTRIIPITGPTSPIEETKPRLSSTTSWSSDSEGAGSLSRNSQIYFSSKARLSFRHQMDSNVNAVDATY